MIQGLPPDSGWHSKEGRIACLVRCLDRPTLPQNKTKRKRSRGQASKNAG